MNKRKAFVFCLTSLIFMLGSVASATDADVAYIVKNFDGVDSFLLSEIDSLGYSHEIIYESEVLATDFDEYRLIVIGDQNLDFPQNIPIDRHRSLTINSYNYYKKTGTTNYQLGWSGSAGTKTSPTTLTRNPFSTSGITTSLPNTFSAYTGPNTNVRTSFLNGQKPTGIDIAVYPSLNSDGVIASLSEGRRLLNGRTLEKRAVFFGVTKAQYWTPQTRIAFENSLEWLTANEDVDGDGFDSEVDCDDGDFDVNPSANETPYDGVDQDCDGEDLTDVDGDGFDSDEVGGLDCNDVDFDVNPLSSDLTLNCVNDAPSLSVPAHLEFYENDEVVFSATAHDPEGDDLTFSIDDLRFVVEGSTFTWQTDYTDSGRHLFEVSVTDGENELARVIEIEIFNRNMPPVLEDVSEAAFYEDGEAILDIEEYVSDGDGDELEIGVYYIDDLNIFVEEMSYGVFKITAEEDFFGEGAIIFYVSDGTDVTLSNEVQVIVEPVNDPVLFDSQIEDFQIYEDEVAENVLDLRDHFSDVDNDFGSLNVYYSMGDGINLAFENGLVSIEPAADFNGQELIEIYVSDGEYTAASNVFTIVVQNAEEAPVFEYDSCVTDLEEDVEYSCLLEISDFENDTLDVYVVEEENIDCEVEENLLMYISEEDYSGEASCIIEASDGTHETRKRFDFVISNVNDAPRVYEFSPSEENVKVVSGKAKTFSISAEDLESDIEIVWRVNGLIRATSHEEYSEFDFHESMGNYFVQADISDGQLTFTKYWNVHVGDTSEFSCIEVGGFTCGGSTACGGETISTNSENICCTTSCIPSFNDSDACTVLNSNIELTLREPDENEEYEIGEMINIEVLVRNDLDEDETFDIEANLYNSQRESSEAEESIELDVPSQRERSVQFELKVPEDIDVSDSFLLFVKATNGQICNQNYTSLNIERPEKKISIRRFELPESANCGALVNAEIQVENLGENEADVDLEIESDSLSLSERESFEVEGFGDKDKVTKKLEFVVPEDIESGNYLIEASVRGVSSSRISKEISILCDVKDERTSERVNQAERLQNSIKLGIGQEMHEEESVMVYIIAALNFVLIALVSIIYVLFGKKN